MQTKYLLVFLLALAAKASDAQTCVIVIKTAKGIYVGADSRVMNYQFNLQTGKTDTLAPLSICKIHSIGIFNFAVIGYFAQTSIDRAIEACSSNKTFSTAMEAYIQSYGQTIFDSLNIYNRAIEEKVTELYNNKEVSEIFFFGYENGQPIITRLLFKIVAMNESNVQIGCDSTIHADTAVSGEYAAIKDIVFKHSTWKDGPITTIKRLINIEEHSSPIVGGPIDIIHVLPSGVAWISRKKMCPLKG
jgi:hypothetical protein